MAAIAEIKMSPRTALRSLRKPSSYRPSPVLDFLVPRLYQVPRHASITTSSAAPSTEPQPESLSSNSTSKRRRPLSKEQKQFLDSAVRPTLLLPESVSR